MATDGETQQREESEAEAPSAGRCVGGGHGESFGRDEAPAAGAGAGELNRRAGSGGRDGLRVGELHGHELRFQLLALVVRELEGPAQTNEHLSRWHRPPRFNVSDGRTVHADELGQRLLGESLGLSLAAEL